MWHRRERSQEYAFRAPLLLFLASHSGLVHMYCNNNHIKGRNDCVYIHVCRCFAYISKVKRAFQSVQWPGFSVYIYIIQADYLFHKMF